MTNLTQRRIAAREIFDESLRAVDHDEAVRRAVHMDGSELNVLGAAIDIENRKVYSIAIGKAANKMASGLEEILGDRLAAGIIACNQEFGNARGGDRVNAPKDAGKLQARMPALPRRFTIFDGGHPEPNEESLAAAQASLELLRRANRERALVIFLISGGGSAMIEWPASNEITLADLRAGNRVLINCGASITEIN